MNRGYNTHPTGMYRVTWEMDIDAEDAEDAARRAREYQIDPEAIVGVFQVRREMRKRLYLGNGIDMVTSTYREEPVTVDLDEIDGKDIG